ncbi:MAG TPA: hypothetical protein VLI39_20205 [Sedimentisphaerales bacterium]|nr:hypothetical protein [Sedimentisphaerales bacterium]
MYYAGIDYHKHYSIVSIQNAQGSIVREQRVEHAFPELFGGLFKECPEPVGLRHVAGLQHRRGPIAEP